MHVPALDEPAERRRVDLDRARPRFGEVGQEESDSQAMTTRGGQPDPGAPSGNVHRAHDATP
jgi:hypothetical protein